MYKGLMFIPLIIAGMATVIWALPAAHRLRRPLDMLASLAAVAGLAAALCGILLTIIPDFIR